MVVHVVVWRVAAKGQAERAAATAENGAMLETLPGLVPGIRGFEVGVNALPGDNAGDVMVRASFADWPALGAYGTHPEHVKVAARIGELTAERRSVDYEA